MLMTRAADEHWDDNDAIGVYMVNAENGIVGDVSNYRYTVVKGGQMVHLFLLMKIIPLIFRKMVL